MTINDVQGCALAPNFPHMVGQNSSPSCRRAKNIIKVWPRCRLSTAWLFIRETHIVFENAIYSPWTSVLQLHFRCPSVFDLWNQIWLSLKAVV